MIKRPALVSIVIPLVLFLANPASFAGAETRVPSATVRDVTPSGVTRVLRRNVPEPRPVRQIRQFENVRLTSNGSLRAAGTTIKLQSIAMPQRERICTSSSGTRWRCGLRAWVALSNLLRAQTVSCDLSPNDELSGVCRVNDVDIALWMLQNGWAELANAPHKDQYVAALALAKANGVGIWVDKPPLTPATIP
jgi:endonuclease YncB( thermonuclease family)